MADKGTITGKDVFDGVYEETDRVNKKFLELLTTFNDLSKAASKIKTSTQATEVIEKGRKAYEEANLALKERERLSRLLAIQEERNRQSTSEVAKSLAKQRYEATQLNRANKESAVSTSNYASAYQKLELQLKKSRDRFRELYLTQGEFAKSTQRAAREVQELDARLKKADAMSGQFQRNVGNYPNKFKGVISTFRGLASAFGAYSAIQIVGQVYSQIKALDGLNKALAQVTETQTNYNQAQAFISGLAEEAGTNILTLTGSYTKFLASAKTTNLTIGETNNIFRQVAKAAGILGLSTQDAQGAFTALEQILSKGKVQAEEIRGQLGERLPGAFQILAKSMGLTTAELSKQLELGNVLSEEVLPGFAAELERTYSLDKVKRVETLAAEQERLGNSWIQFIQNVENGDGTLSKVLGGALSMITAVTDALGKLVQSSKSVNTDIRTERAKNELELLKDIAEETGQSMREVAESNFFNYTKSVEKAREEVQRLKKEQEKILKEGPGLITGFGSSTNTGLSENKRQLDLAEKALAIREGRLAAINEAIRAGKKELNDEFESGPNTLNALNEKLKGMRDLLAGTEIGTEAFKNLKKDISELEKFIEKVMGDGVIQAFKEGSIAYYEDLIKAEKAKQVNEVLTTQAMKASVGKVKEYQDAIEQLTSAFNLFNITQGKVVLNGSDGSEKNYQDRAKDKAYEGLKKSGFDFDGPLKALEREVDLHKETEKRKTKISKEEAEKRSEIFSVLFGSFANTYGLDLTLFEKLISKEKVALQDYSSFAISTTAAFFDGKNQKYEEDANRNRATLDAILNDNNASDKKKEQAQKEFDKKEKKLSIKKAKAAKEEALFQIAISTAVAFVKSLPNYILGATVIAAGAIQAGLVASRKIPEYFKGTENAPRGWAWTDEKGPEIHADRFGNIKDLGSVEGPRLKFLESGDKLFTAERTKKILDNQNSAENIKYIMSKRMARDMRERERYVPQATVDTKGMEKAVERAMEKAMSKYVDRPNIVKVEAPPRTRY